MLAGRVGALVIEKPAPDAVMEGKLTSEMVICGLLTVNVRVPELLPPAIILPKLIAVAGCAVSRTPVESVYVIRSELISPRTLAVPLPLIG